MASRRAWAAVAHAIADFQAVSVLVDPADEAIAPAYLGAHIQRHICPLDDAWLRDIGPSFVLGDDGRLGAVDWRFNGWGAREWARWAHDDRVAAFVADWRQKVKSLSGTIEDLVKKEELLAEQRRR